MLKGRSCFSDEDSLIFVQWKFFKGLHKPKGHWLSLTSQRNMFIIQLMLKPKNTPNQSFDILIYTHWLYHNVWNVCHTNDNTVKQTQFPMVAALWSEDWLLSAPDDTYFCKCVCACVSVCPGVPWGENETASYQDTHTTALHASGPPIRLYYKIWFIAPKYSHEVL